MEHYIYKIVNLINGKYYYGKRSCNCLAVDDKYMGSGTLLMRSQKNHGIHNFAKEILAYCESSEDALELEEMAVTLEEVNNPMCYNMKVGGAGGGAKGRVFSEESKQKMREYRAYTSKETRRKISESKKGIKPSDEARRKQSEAQRGTKRSEEAIKNMSKAQKDRNFKHTDETKQMLSELRKGKKASEESRRNQSEAQKGRTLSNETKNKIAEAHKNRPRVPVYQYSKDGELIKIWDRVSDITEALNIHRGDINRCCSGKLKTSHGFIWRRV